MLRITFRHFSTARNPTRRAFRPFSSIWLAWNSSVTTSQRAFSFSAMLFCTSSMNGSSESNSPIFWSSQTGSLKRFFSAKTFSNCRSALEDSGRCSSTLCTSTRLSSLLSRMFGPENALRYFRIALHYVAKSGELWCEGARIFLDPTSPHFSLQNARIALNYAVIFTPRYGDTFIEVFSVGSC